MHNSKNTIYTRLYITYTSRINDILQREVTYGCICSTITYRLYNSY